MSASKDAIAFAPAGAQPHDLSYYLKCCVGGILSCGLTHTAIVPLDIVKCRMQVCGAGRLGARARVR